LRDYSFFVLKPTNGRFFNKKIFKKILISEKKASKQLPQNTQHPKPIES
jgi:hypothetical protein